MFAGLRSYASGLSLLLLFVASIFSLSSRAAATNATPQIVDPVNESDLVTLAGSTHPLAKADFDQGLVSDSLPMQHIFVVLRRSAQQESALEHVIDRLQDPHSALYHKWLSADELGRKFGPTHEDIETVVRWLASHGLRVNLLHKARLAIDVSGTAAQIADAFHTEIHGYVVNGEHHIANASDLKIPAALAPVVVGVVSLNDFFPKPLMKRSSPDFSFPCTGCPEPFTSAQLYFVAPADFNTIYNVSPLYKLTAPITGKGQTIVVLEESDIQAADVGTFRKAFGLSGFTGTFTQIHPGPGCSDPGRNIAEGEAAVDAEWAGAAAPGAAVELASCNDTTALPGNLLAAQNLVDGKTPPDILSLSFGECEAALGTGGNKFFANLWQQAATEGISVFVSAGDGASDACDDFSTSSFASSGLGVSGFASTAYNLAAGGTDFIDTILGQNSTYWNATNSSTGASAKSYVPEIPWNESCANSVVYKFFGFTDPISFCNSAQGQDFFIDILGGGGGSSSVYAKPSWQAGIPGMPKDGKRDLPDVSLFASDGFLFHSLLFCMSDAVEGGSPCNYSNPTDALFNSAGGTSFTAPQLASIQALINQKVGGRQGNPAPIYYKLYTKEFGTASTPNTTAFGACNANKGNAVSTSCIFHDVTQGNNDVPCITGSPNCFSSTSPSFGVLSKSNTALQPAYPAITGYDLASGLGSVNVTNLVNNWP